MGLRPTQRESLKQLVFALIQVMCVDTHACMQPSMHARTLAHTHQHDVFARRCVPSQCLRHVFVLSDFQPPATNPQPVWACSGPVPACWTRRRECSPQWPSAMPHWPSAMPQWPSATMPTVAQRHAYSGPAPACRTRRRECSAPPPSASARAAGAATPRPRCSAICKVRPPPRYPARHGAARRTASCFARPGPSPGGQHRPPARPL